MSKQVKWRRGTTAEHNTFIGAVGEVTVDTSKHTVVVHDGVTLGGHSAELTEKPASTVSKDGGGSVQDFIDSVTFPTVADMLAFPRHVAGTPIEWDGYYTRFDGGGNKGVVKTGGHSHDGGSIFSLGENLYVEANLKGERISTRKFGAKIDSDFNASNSPTDDTQAVQNLINFLDGESYNTGYSPGGFSLVTQIVGKAGVVIEGDGPGVSYFIQKAGETVPIYTDDGTAYNLWTKNISFDCNNNVIPTAGVYLGYGGQQLGVVSGIENITVRNVVGNGAMLNGNVTKYDTMEFQNCSKRGVIFDGEGSKAYNIFGSDCGEGVAKLKGSSNLLVGGHVESGSSIGAFEIGAATVGNVIKGIKGTGVGANVHNAIVLISAGASNYSVSDVVASVAGLSNIPNGLIYDVSSGVRKIYGVNTANLAFSVPNYDGGSRTQLPYKDSIPPTLGTHKVGDWFISGVGIAGFPMGWVANNSGDAATTGTFTAMMSNAGAVIKTASETLARTDIGKRFCNDGASSDVTLTLPVIQVGDRIHFTRRNATWKLLIDPNGSQLIRPAMAGKYLSLDTDGASVTLEYMSTNSWCVVAQSGTVSFEP